MNKLFSICLVIFNAFLCGETLFEVKDASNNKVLDVSTDGLRVMNQGDTLMVIGSEGIKVFIEQDSTKALSRKFSVSTTSAKGTKAQSKVFEVATDEGATFYNPLNNADKIFSINKTSIIANVDNGLDRDFVINGTAAGKLGDNLMKISDKDIFEAINDSTMLFYKKKNAFRVGYVKIDTDNEVGQASFATGYQSKASGPCASAFGIKTESTGYGSTSMGTLTKAQAISSTAMGSSTIASGYNSTATGWLTTSQSLNEFATGSLNVDWGSASLWNETDPLFVVGNGILTKGDKAIYRNAVTVLKNGYTSIGNIVPSCRLDVAGDIRINDNALYLRSGTMNGVQYSESWAGTTIQGPLIFGQNGGALGTTNDNSICLRWDYLKNIYIPAGSLTVSTGNVTVTSGDMKIPGLYTETIGVGTKKTVYVDSLGKLCVAAKGDEENEKYEKLQNENKDLRNQLSDLREELEEIKRILNKN